MQSRDRQPRQPQIRRPDRRSPPKPLAREGLLSYMYVARFPRARQSLHPASSSMANIVLVGAQWGDEGKGKIIDVLTRAADLVVRSQGGNNAGHTIVHGDTRYVLHLIPSGILRPDKVCVIGNGVVIDPVALVGEIDGLRAVGVSVENNLFISDRAHLVLPYHRMIDEHREHLKGTQKIGTTKRGIGPAYGDKAARIGLRVADLMQPAKFSAKLGQRVQEANQILQTFGMEGISFGPLEAAYLEAGEKLRPFVTNTVVYLHQALAAKKSILFEGAQGTFLDLDHGTYPYVTSSNTTAGGACTGSGVPPHCIKKVVGVMKAYTTRVGEGPIPSEDHALSELLHGMGRDFGATTGRPRRCDAVATRFSTMVNGTDALAVTNLDGLDSLETIKICVSYRLDGKTIEVPPTDHEDFARCEPVYVTMPGWQTPLEDARKHRDLPKAARRYLKEICRLTGAELELVSVGPRRAQTIRV